ncbi:MAG: sulfotransferase family protein [Planctomycetota bacterium]|jgi:hypothetical protein
MHQKALEAAEYSELSPVFILGITRRSGTNFLQNLLCLHPECYAGGVIHEDFLLSGAELLDKYANSVSRNWNLCWVEGKQCCSSDAMCRYIGKGLTAFLQQQNSGDIASQVDSVKSEPGNQSGLSAGRLVTRTPSVRNLKHFFKFFPGAGLLIIVRDGRSVAESGVKSFGWHYEDAFRSWATAARTILNFDAGHKNTQHKYMIVKYEELNGDTEQQLRRIFDFFGLDSEKYDFNSAKNLPVSGSSQLRDSGQKDIHWRPVEKTQDFDPSMRFGGWGRSLFIRVWLCQKRVSEFSIRMVRVEHFT